MPRDGSSPACANVARACASPDKTDAVHPAKAETRSRGKTPGATFRSRTKRSVDRGPLKNVFENRFYGGGGAFVSVTEASSTKRSGHSIWPVPVPQPVAESPSPWVTQKSTSVICWQSAGAFAGGNAKVPLSATHVPPDGSAVPLLPPVWKIVFVR